MVNPENLIKFLSKNNINFFTGVPDSTLKNFTNFIEDKKNHYTAVNEGSAVAMAIGYNLSTKKIPLIYLQNSGLSNAMNPLISIAHKKVYSIPLLLVIGWRGYPKIKDEPQHQVKGKITTKILNAMNIKYCILKKESNFRELKKIIHYAKKKGQPVACLVPPNTFLDKKNQKKIIKNNDEVIRHTFLKLLINNISKNTKIISSTGYNSRELLRIRTEFKNLNKGKDFYMVGGMGHASLVALSTSLHSKSKVICLDGDGSLLMHLGSLFSAGLFGNKNFKHILLNNNSHESVGGQKTFLKNISLKNIVKAFRYKNYYFINKKSNLAKKIKSFINEKGPSFMEVRIQNSFPKNLPRPKNLIEIKKKFIN